MKRSNVLLFCALVGLLPTACSSGGAPDPNGNRSTQVDLDHLTITVSGRAELLPEAAHLLDAQGQRLPALDGLTVTLEEPWGMGVNDENAVLGEGLLGEDHAFSVSDVLVRGIHLSLAARLEHPGLVRSSTVIFDTALARTRPSTDISDTRAWALPEAFEQTLTRSIGEAAIRGHSDQRAGTLRDAGFVLGRIVDASGEPLAGAVVVPDREELASRIYYPSPDFQGAPQDGTSTTGLFVYVHSATAPESFLLSVKGSEDHGHRNVAVTPGTALVLTLSPGNDAR
ncbi:hypothetical protein CYFUS_000628 [Cystobacter fuscus]|uniref:Lipoprotein n=1 Tax=Cystobacter fuscus TaxID=43 RepID=A0A250IWE4_9BACT|nr:carboxypeptidase regulatory-like domain-containing protein [Cystobacter fuscus]ATB35216.1 hypothetical protein CYFUS_000628 [Cystobacter fuscus]